MEDQYKDDPYREDGVRERSREIEEATIPPIQPLDHYDDYHLKAVNELKKEFNDSLELFSDKLIELENEVAVLTAELKRRPYEGSLSENDILKVVGVILGNDKLSEYLGQKIRDKFRDKVKVNFEIG